MPICCAATVIDVSWYSALNFQGIMQQVFHARPANELKGLAY